MEKDHIAIFGKYILRDLNYFNLFCRKKICGWRSSSIHDSGTHREGRRPQQNKNVEYFYLVNSPSLRKPSDAC